MKPTDRLADWIYEHLGTEWCGKAGPPGDKWRIDFGPDAYPSLAVLNNDGTELWLGMAYEWHTHMSRKQARQLAWWLLRCEVALWFGLRRKVWYWALFRRVKRRRGRAA